MAKSSSSRNSMINTWCAPKSEVQFVPNDFHLFKFSMKSQALKSFYE